jgi:quercetin dioxygenase-like cupin family protein
MAVSKRLSPLFGIWYDGATFWMKTGVYIGEKIEKPWGYELIWAHTDRYVGKILHIQKGQLLSYQYHRIKDETIRVLSGSLDLEVETDGERKVLRLKPGDCFHITPGMKHRMEAAEECDVLETSTPELEDVVRLEDRYGRATKG